MGGRGANSKLTQATPPVRAEALSDTDLEREYQAALDEMARLAPFAVPKRPEPGDEAKKAAYYQAQSRMIALRDESDKRARGDQRVDLGLGISASQKTLRLRQQINQLIGAGIDDEDIRWSVRKDIAAGKTEAQVYQEDTERLARISARKAGGKKTFVNSFGEATKREITSSSYKRQQSRLEKEIQGRMRGR